MIKARRVMVSMEIDTSKPIKEIKETIRDIFGIAVKQIQVNVIKKK